MPSQVNTFSIHRIINENPDVVYDAIVQSDPRNGWGSAKKAVTEGFKENDIQWDLVKALLVLHAVHQLAGPSCAVPSGVPAEAIAWRRD
jgi:hypothetical protein